LAEPPRSGTVFATADLFVDYAKRHAAECDHNAYIKLNEKRGRIRAVCARAGMCVSNATKKQHTKTKTINCPFRYQANLRNGVWVVSISDNSTFHQHDPVPSDVPRSPSNDQKLFVKEHALGKGRKGAGKIARALADRHPQPVFQKKAVHNLVYQLRRDELRGQTAISALVEQVAKAGCSYDVFTCIENDCRLLTRLFVSTPSAIGMAKSYGQVLVIDATCKENRFRLPLVKIVGIDCFNSTFIVAFAFVSKETNEDYTWVLQRLRNLVFSDTHESPQVFVTDQEDALIGAIESNFPNATSLTCTGHFMQSVPRNCRKEFCDVEVFEEFNETVKSVVYAPTEEDTIQYWDELLTLEGEERKAADYVARSLPPIETKLVKCFTDKMIHLGTIATLRVEGFHSVLKKELDTSQADILTTTSVLIAIMDDQAKAYKTAWWDHKKSRFSPYETTFSLGFVTRYRKRLLQLWQGW
jgi:hypothetical protein